MSGMRRVGRELSSAERWRDRGGAYARQIDGPYHRHRLAVVASLLPPLGGAAVLDFGCGEGALLREARRRGAASLVGVDADPEMVARASGSAHRLVCGGVEALAGVEAAGCLLAVNVLAYLPPDDEARFYREAARILDPGGVLVVTHSNELFDMFTLNAFTVDFFRTHLGADPTPLLARPREPARPSFSIRENPLTYGRKLARHGFRQDRVEYINAHPAPPLLMDTDADDIDAREYPDTLQVAEDERWTLMFRCSMFGVRAVRE